MDDQGELAGEPPDVAAEGEVAEAGGGVDQEVADDEGGGAAAELVDAAEQQAEGEVAEEAAEALVEVVGAAEQGAGPQGLGGGPAELVEAAQQVAADDHLFEEAAAGGGQQQDRDRPPVAGGGDRDHGAVDAEADGQDVDADADGADQGGQADPPAQVRPGAGGVEADAGRRLARAAQEVEDEDHRDQRGGQVEQLVDQPDVGEQGRLDPADGRRQDVDDRVQRRGGQRQGQDQRHLVPEDLPVRQTVLIGRLAFGQLRRAHVAFNGNGIGSSASGIPCMGAWTPPFSGVLGSSHRWSFGSSFQGAGFAAVRPTASAFPSRGIGDLAARLAVQGPGTLGPGGEIGGGVAVSVHDEAASIAVEHPLGQLHSHLDGAAPRAGPT